MQLNELVPDEIIVQLDKPRKIQYRFLAWRHLEARFGGQEQVLAAVAALLPRRKGQAPDPILENLLWLLWAGLIQEDRALTVDQVEEMLEINRVPEYIVAVSRAIAAAFPERENAARPPEPSAGNGTGAGRIGSPGVSAI